MENTTAKLRAILLAFFFTIVAFSSFVSATDSDGDGLDDVNDDCPFAAGTSTIDRQGCPDRDGDGTSDIADGWTSNNPNFSEEMAITTSNNMIAIDHDPTGTMVVAAEEDVLRIWNATSHVNIRSSVSLVSSGSCTWGGSAAICSVEWSPDGQYIAVSLSDDTAAVLWADNLTVIHDGITHTGSSRLFSDVAFMPNSTTFAVVDEVSGGGGGGCTGCSVMFVDVLSGTIWKELTQQTLAHIHPLHFQRMEQEWPLVAMVRCTSSTLHHGGPREPSPAEIKTSTPSTFPLMETWLLAVQQQAAEVPSKEQWFGIFIPVQQNSPKRQQPRATMLNFHPMAYRLPSDLVTLEVMEQALKFTNSIQTSLSIPSLHRDQVVAAVGTMIAEYITEFHGTPADTTWHFLLVVET